MALVIALATAAVPLGMGLSGIVGDMWRGSLSSVFGASGTAIGILAALSWTLRDFGTFFGGRDSHCEA